MARTPPALIAGHRHATLLSPDGEIRLLVGSALTAALREMAPPLVVHAPLVRKRLHLNGPALRDLLELFAFVLPARSTAPTPRGLAMALDLEPPESDEAAVILLPEIAANLLRRLAAGKTLPINRHAAGVARRMEIAGWEWAGPVLQALGEVSNRADGFRVWQFLPEWQEHAPPPPPASHPVSADEARTRLAALLGPNAEQRPGQADYSAAAAAAFAPRDAVGAPHLVLAEAGTGTGKTLGYIAPASLWAERNGAPVWISTFTRHLQRQIDAELARLYPDPLTRRARVVVRKGRENYLCLLNYEDVLGPVLGGSTSIAIPLGLISRWALMTSDGDISGGDLPGWFSEIFGAALLAQLADRRGECIHGGCRHYTRCFVEHSIRRARGADLVVANHALVMTQAALGGLDDGAVPTRYVFDEGHHLFEAADSAFAAEFSGREGAELRRWLLGAEGSRSRARGLKARIGDLVAGDSKLEAPLNALMQAAASLPRAEWLLAGEETQDLAGGVPANPAHAFLQALRRQVLARAASDKPDAQNYGDLECDLYPASDDLIAASIPLRRALSRIAEPARLLIARLQEKLEEDAEDIDTAARERIETMCRSLQRRALNPLTLWGQMLAAVAENPPEPGDRPSWIRYLSLTRDGKRDRDALFSSHHLDPTLPFALTLAAPAHGVLVTSATLRDAGGMTETDAELSWDAAEARIGAPHLAVTPQRASLPSPFDYARQTRCFVVNDVAADIPSLAGAYKSLFVAAGGGGLGLFTAISRLRAVHEKIAPALEDAGIALFSQHVDAMDNATLVDVFRTETNSCLLGTDAMRDGVDVPGRALRLVVFERVPWPRPDILHRERRIHLSGGDTAGYDDRIARLRLRQAFGRLIRSATDIGVFVLLDRRAPTRLLSAFPAGVEVKRAGLADVVGEVAAFLKQA